nr:MAG TPA: tail fiber assembly protein [Caudoviricetes sp.]
MKNPTEIMYFYDKATNGFYIEGLHEIPADATEIDEESYRNLLEGQATGKQIIANKQGNPVLVDPQPSAAHELNLETLQWTISKEKQLALFNKEKEALLNRLVDKADEIKTNLLVGYPQTEIESFYRQEKEALAWQADNKVDTPMLKQIARVRGVPFEVLVGKVIEKASQFAVAIGVIIGQRQAFEDKLLGLSSQKELDELKKEIEEWKFQAN